MISSGASSSGASTKAGVHSTATGTSASHILISIVDALISNAVLAPHNHWSMPDSKTARSVLDVNETIPLVGRADPSGR